MNTGSKSRQLDEIHDINGPQQGYSRAKGADAQAVSVPPMLDVHRMITCGFHHLQS
jgi:hypothetical protein